MKSLWQAFEFFAPREVGRGRFGVEWVGVKGRLLLNIRVSEQTSYAVMAAGGVYISWAVR